MRLLGGGSAIFDTGGVEYLCSNILKKMLPFPSGENIFGQFPAAALSVSWYLIRMKILGSEYGALGLVEHCALQAKHKDLQSLHIRVNFTNIQIR